MREHDEPSSTDPTEIEAVITRLKQSNLAESDTRLIERLLRLLLTLTRLVEQKNFSISRLKRMLFGPSSDRRATSRKPAPKLAETSVNKAAPAPEESPPATEPKARRQGHGRLAASDYTGARVVHCQPEAELSAGAACPHPHCTGHLYDTRQPQIFIRLTGQPIISATRYEQEVLRCSACQERFTAPLPKGVPAQKYDPSADVSIALYKYGAGMPFYRQARLQALCGVPLPESVQYERCAAVAALVRPVYEELMRQAAGADVLHTDDTRVVILDFLKENRRLPEGSRRATQTTGIVARVGQDQIALYVSGRRHAGENIAELLGGRPPELAAPIQMSDALAANWGGEFKRIVAKCLAHARRQFVEIEAAFPAECARVLDAIGAVYSFDSRTRAMNDEERLRFHQHESAPVLAGLREWLDEQLAERRVEPNSSLGRAFAYLTKHWEGLTKFLTVAGAPLDNNVCERALKLAVLNRKNALFYKTARGASTGDVLMSVIETCRLNRVNVWEYLLAVVRDEGSVKRDPRAWLPWRFAAEGVRERAA